MEKIIKYFPFMLSLILLSACGPRDCLMAFESDRDNNREIYVFNFGTDDLFDSHGIPSDRDLIRLTNNSTNDSFPGWDEWGDNIIFLTDRGGEWDMYLMDNNGNLQRPVPEDDTGKYYLDWSRDCSKVVYSQHLSGNVFEIMMLDIESDTITQLTSNRAINIYPRWRYDNDQESILLISNKDGAFAEYFMSVDTGFIFDSNLNEDLDALRTSSNKPDCTLRAFSDDFAGDYEIYVIDDMGTLHHLTNNENIDVHPSWSPFCK